jgi:N-acetylneuraminate synthase
MAAGPHGKIFYRGKKKMISIKIGYKKISQDSKPFIIAEIGVNYYDVAKKQGLTLIDAAKLMIKEAKNAGADAVKFQSYKAEKLASIYSPAYWDTTKEKTKSQHELFKKFDKFGEEDFKELSNFCKKNNIIFMSTPFDFESADYLEKLMPVYKISSSDITNHPFIEYIAGKKKPILLSTGASNIKEIKDAVKVITKTGNKEIVIMHCILSYPTSFADANLGMIKHLKTVFPGHIIGYSDHTPPDENMLVLLTSFLFGAKIIEKHFTLDKKLLGNDHYHAMDPADLKKFLENVNHVVTITGDCKKRLVYAEKNSRKFARRSIVAYGDITKGKIITKDMIAFKRPGTGISPQYYKKIIGKKASRDVKNDEILVWDDLKD